MSVWYVIRVAAASTLVAISAGCGVVGTPVRSGAGLTAAPGGSLCVVDLDDTTIDGQKELRETGLYEATERAYYRRVYQVAGAKPLGGDEPVLDGRDLDRLAADLSQVLRTVQDVVLSDAKFGLVARVCVNGGSALLCEGLYDVRLFEGNEVPAALRIRRVGTNGAQVAVYLNHELFVRLAEAYMVFLSFQESDDRATEIFDEIFLTLERSLNVEPVYSECPVPESDEAAIGTGELA